MTHGSRIALVGVLTLAVIGVFLLGFDRADAERRIPLADTSTAAETLARDDGPRTLAVPVGMTSLDANVSTTGRQLPVVLPPAENDFEYLPVILFGVALLVIVPAGFQILLRRSAIGRA